MVVQFVRVFNFYCEFIFIGVVLSVEGCVQNQSDGEWSLLSRSCICSCQSPRDFTGLRLEFIFQLGFIAPDAEYKFRFHIWPLAWGVDLMF
jgi:hypothetical protein